MDYYYESIFYYLHYLSHYIYILKYIKFIMNGKIHVLLLQLRSSIRIFIY